MHFLTRRQRAAFALALCAPALACASLSYDETLRLAQAQAPSLLSQQLALASAQAAQPAAASLPTPQLTLGVDNLPISGADRLALTRDGMTMQRIGLMQDMPNSAKREARAAGAQARVERERAQLAVVALAVRREAALAWLGLHFAQSRLDALAAVARENQLLLATLDARIASGKAMPVDRSMAQQEALALADRHDDLQRDVAKARTALRRWVGERAHEPLQGDPPALNVAAPTLRQQVAGQAELAPFAAMQAMAQAELREADADQRGDWGWEVVYSRRGAQYGDMVSFQLRFDLPWAREQRVQAPLLAKQQELARVAAERDDMLRRRQDETEAQLADLQALEQQFARLQSQGLPLAAERTALALASYQAGRADLGTVLTARREAAETQLRLLDLNAQRHALRVRLTTLTAE